MKLIKVSNRIVNLEKVTEVTYNPTARVVHTENGSMFISWGGPDDEARAITEAHVRICFDYVVDGTTQFIDLFGYEALKVWDYLVLEKSKDVMKEYDYSECPY